MSCYLAIFWSYFSLPRTISTVLTNVVLSPYFIPGPQSVFYTDWFRNITRGIYAKYQSLQNTPLPIQSFLKKIAKTLDTGMVYSRMWHWGDFRENNAVRALFPPQRPLCVVGRLEREKWKRAAEVCKRLLVFYYGYQAGTPADERGQCDKRGAEMIRNKRRTLSIKVRIDLVARLIITLTHKSEGEISWCYRSKQTSLVKRLHSTTFYKTKFDFPREFFSATIRSIRSEGLNILKSQKYPLVNSLSLFFNRKKKQIN